MTLYSLFKKARSADWSEANAYNVQWSVEHHEGVAYFFVRETSGLDSWLKVNLRFAPKGATVHRGFDRAWKSIRDEVVGALKGSEKVIAAGFSKGGGIVTVAHKDLQAIFPAVRTYAFGAPRVFTWRGWRQNRDSFDQLKRVYVRGDAVTHLPPLVLGFRHVGEGEAMGILGFFLVPLVAPLSLVFRAFFHHPNRYEKLLKGRQ